MSWTDPEGPWQRAQRTRVRGSLVGIAVTLLMLLVVAALVTNLTMRSLQIMPGADIWDVVIGPPILVVAFGATAFAIALVLLTRRLRIDRAVLHRIPRHDGIVCMQCRTVGTVDNWAVRCPKCDWRESVEDTRAYWATYPFQPGFVRLTAMGVAYAQDAAILAGLLTVISFAVPRFL